jgi:hypothetical protein
MIGKECVGMITEIQIRERLIDYLIRQITLNEFEDWLVQQSWNMHLDSDARAQHLVGMIELRLAEYSNGHLTDDALERELKGLVGTSADIVMVHDAGRSASAFLYSTKTAANEWLQLNWSPAQVA